MKPLLRSAVILGALALSGTARPAKAQDTYTFLTGNTTVNYAIATDYAIIGYASGNILTNFQNASSPTVNLVSGGSAARFIATYNRSTLNINGGSVGGSVLVFNNTTANLISGTVNGLTSYDIGTVNISGGTLDNNLVGSNLSTLNVSGGMIIGSVFVSGNGIVNLSGGMITSGLVAYDNGRLNFFGSNLAATLINPNSPTGYSRYALSGTLTDGTVYTNTPFFIQNGTGASFNLNPGTSISGTVTLQGAVNSTRLITFRLVPSDGTEPLIRTVTLNPDGTFSLIGLPAKSYNVRVKGAKWLAEVVPFDTTSGNISDATVTLRGGDANDDNAVDIADLTPLIAAYNQSSPAAGYLDAADFNNDGVNDISDLSILISNYNQVGG